MNRSRLCRVETSSRGRAEMGFCGPDNLISIAKLKGKFGS